MFMNVLKKILPILLIIVAAFFVTIVSHFVFGQSSNINISLQQIEVRDGAELYKKQLANGNEAYLQVIDVRKMQIDQLIGEVDKMGISQGAYYQGEAQYYSPFFEMKLFSEVAEEYKKLYDSAVFSAINCSFFEQYLPSSQLSFPVKVNGQIVTAGNSPYGPIKQPKDEFHQTVRLKALVWNEKEVYITDYTPETGKPLSDREVQNAVVTYLYSDHPAKVLANNPINRYHVIGTLNKDGTDGDESLAILTVNRATLDEAANLLRELGVQGDIITIDGGTSTYVFSFKLGDIMVPQSSSAISAELPHYLGFRNRKTKPASPHIAVSQPTGKIQVEQNKPYLILWRDNLENDVKIELYEGNRLIQTIATRTASDGVYEWTPGIPVKPGYLMRISSVENSQVFGVLQL
jgi:hypothetical protein